MRKLFMGLAAAGLLLTSAPAFAQSASKLARVVLASRLDAIETIVATGCTKSVAYTAMATVTRAARIRPTAKGMAAA